MLCESIKSILRGRSDRMLTLHMADPGLTFLIPGVQYDFSKLGAISECITTWCNSKKNVY